ncbi:CLC_0170 family protein [Cohnella sp.]|uniref:CLC_0170 family protein n=1 Tax=Cohnella sp. TaxID=1883426 RepID=UPI00356470A8
MRGSGYIGSLGYIVPLCLITGVLLLRWEVVMYQKTKLKREKNFARTLGWINVIAGIGMYAGNWIVSKLI